MICPRPASNGAEQVEGVRSVISFYEKRIEESLSKRDFDIARSWYHEMCGAYFLADRLGVLVDHQQAENEWFQRIQTAQYGQRGAT